MQREDLKDLLWFLAVVRERSFTQFAERRQEGDVGRRLRVSWRNAPEAEHENQQPLPGTPEMLDYW